MAAWGYEFYLLVLKVSLTRSLRSLVTDYFQLEKIKFVSPRVHVIFCISHTSKSRLHNVIALLCLCAVYFTYFL